MVVDDEADIVTVLKRGLEEDGFEVDSFTDPRKAIDNFVIDKYAMLIVDIRMPRINGFELYRQVRQLDNNIKVVFMTAFEISESEFRQVMPNIDVRTFFKKPVKLKDLLERIKRKTSQFPIQ